MQDSGLINAGETEQSQNKYQKNYENEQLKTFKNIISEKEENDNNQNISKTNLGSYNNDYDNNETKIKISLNNTVDQDNLNNNKISNTKHISRSQTRKSSLITLPRIKRQFSNMTSLNSNTNFLNRITTNKVDSTLSPLKKQIEDEVNFNFLLYI